jgi:hypothetical protein
MEAARCAFQSGDTSRARELLDEVLRVTDRGPDRARPLIHMALVRGYDDDLRAAESLLGEAIENADGDAELRAEAHLLLGGILFRLRERLREAVEHSTAGAASARVDLQAEAMGSRLLAEAALADPGAPATLRGRWSSTLATAPPRDGAAVVPGGVHLAMVGRARASVGVYLVVMVSIVAALID